MSGIGGIGGGGAGGFAGAGGIKEILALRQQIIDRSQVLQQVHTPTGTAATTQSDGASGGFAGALKSALDTVNASQNRADQLSEAYEKGQVTDIAQVMLARQEAGIGFEATLQVRNKLLNAYQDIMRMGV